MLKTPQGKLAFIDFGMMADIDEEDRYGLFGLVIGLQNKDLPLVTENLLNVRLAGVMCSLISLAKSPRSPMPSSFFPGSLDSSKIQLSWIC